MAETKTKKRKPEESVHTSEKKIRSTGTDTVLRWDNIETSLRAEWHLVLKHELSHSMFRTLKKKLTEREKKEVIFPPKKLVFNALNLVLPWKVKVVILGQDPYHNYGQAHGLSFSVPTGIPAPPSLQRIFQKVKQEYPEFKIPDPSHSELSGWAEQGVLLLNSVLTVKEKTPNSHKCLGWERLTREVLRFVFNSPSPDKIQHCVAICWGNDANELLRKIDVNKKKHLLIKGPHPSPYTKETFFKDDYFRKCNKFLEAHKMDPIDWTRTMSVPDK